MQVSCEDLCNGEQWSVCKAYATFVAQSKPTAKVGVEPKKYLISLTAFFLSLSLFFGRKYGEVDYIVILNIYLQEIALVFILSAEFHSICFHFIYSLSSYNCPLLWVAVKV